MVTSRSIWPRSLCSLEHIHCVSIGPAALSWLTSAMLGWKHKVSRNRGACESNCRTCCFPNQNLFGILRSCRGKVCLFTGKRANQTKSIASSKHRAVRFELLPNRGRGSRRITSRSAFPSRSPLSLPLRKQRQSFAPAKSVRRSPVTSTAVKTKKRSWTTVVYRRRSSLVACCPYQHSSAIERLVSRPVNADSQRFSLSFSARSSTPPSSRTRFGYEISCHRSSIRSFPSSRPEA